MRQIFMTFHKHSLAIFATHVAMSVLIALIITPICLWGIRLGVSLSGGAALTDLDIARFLLSPLGLVVAPVIGALIVTAVMLELAAMLVVMRRGDTLGQTLRFLAGRLPRMLRFAGELILRVSVIVVPFAAVIALVVLPQIKEFNINYYLTFRPPEFTRALLMAAPVALALLGTLIWCLSGWVLGLPLILFTDTPAKACFGKSADMTKGHRLSVCLTLVSWATLMVLVAAAVSFGMRAIIIGLMPPITAGLLVVSLLALVALVLWSLANLLIVAIGVGLLATSIDALFQRVMPDLSVPAVDAAPRPRGLVIGALLVASVAAVFTGWAFMQRALPDQPVAVIAHRGAAGTRPENTLAAVNEAIRQGADWIEIDVQETADGEVIVIHDSDFMKIAGNPLKVWDATMNDLPDIDVGSWFDPSFEKERILTLRDVLEASKGSANVLVELKYYGHDDQLSARVAQIVEEAEMVDHTAFMSLKPDQLADMQATRPTWSAGLLAATSVGDLSQFPADFLAVNSATTSAAFVARAQAAGKKVYVWTVNDPVQMSQMISLGDDGLITDEPARAVAVIRQRTGMTTAQRLLLDLAVVFGFDGSNRGRL